DTIKITEVLDTAKTLRNTFLSEFKDVPGASQVFNKWTTDLQSPTFHYVSGGPWNLAPELDSFMQAKSFPAGTLALRDLSILDGSAFRFTGAEDSTSEFKISSIVDIATRLGEQRKFVMIGDSTQKDPEVYGEVARRIGDARVQCIFIREVSGVDAAKEATLNTPERFAQAFNGVQESKTFVFQDYAQLAALDVAGGRCRP
ncbi:hypothetical protein HK102_004765, partial [Quaeritorhiza haematococci]